MIKKIILFLLVLALIPNAFAEKIVIVGAGLSGLTTAYRLQKTFQSNKQFHNKHIEIEIFEAKNRPGGRVFTVDLNGIPVELGGENIQDGGEAKNIRRLLNELGLKTQTYNVLSKNTYFNAEDKKYYQIYIDLMPTFPDITEEEIKETLAKIEKRSKNLGEVIDEFFNQFRPQDEEQNRKFQILKKVLMHKMQSNEGGDVRNLSTRYAHGSLLEMIHRLREGYQSMQAGQAPTFPIESVKDGNSRLVLALTKSLGSKLHLRSPLQKVTESSDHHLLLAFGGKHPQLVKADILVLTIPCTVYKNIKFGTGTISQERLNQIASIPYGSHGKIIVPSNMNNRINCIAFTDDMSSWINLKKGETTLYFNGILGQLKNEKAFIPNLTIGIQGFKSVGTKPKGSSIDMPTEIFSSYYGPIGISWIADPYIKGSYSYYSPLTVNELEREVEIHKEKLLPIFIPIDKKIFFAGEHTTTSQDIRGTMEAAVESGEKASRLIIWQLKNGRGSSLEF